jgi:hypothetical protein
MFCLIISEMIIKSMAISYVIYLDDNHSMTLNPIMILHYLLASSILLTHSFYYYLYSVMLLCFIIVLIAFIIISMMMKKIAFMELNL